jgi:hypothetical protein
MVVSLDRKHALLDPRFSIRSGRNEIEISQNSKYMTWGAKCPSDTANIISPQHCMVTNYTHRNFCSSALRSSCHFYPADLALHHSQARSSCSASPFLINNIKYNSILSFVYNISKATRFGTNVSDARVELQGSFLSLQAKAEKPPPCLATTTPPHQI